MNRFGYDIGASFMRDSPAEFTEEELTFYWPKEDYREFLEELEEYEACPGDVNPRLTKK